MCPTGSSSNPSKTLLLATKGVLIGPKLIALTQIHSGNYTLTSTTSPKLCARLTLTGFFATNTSSAI